jgi:hypothetical protein
MDDLSTQDMTLFREYPVDPGHRHLVTSIDENGHCIRFSNNEWYTKAGVMKRRWNQQERKKETGIDQIESGLLSRKTSYPEYFVDTCQQVFDNLPRLRSFYRSGYPNDRFLSYVSGQKMANEVVNIFVNGGIKYSRRYQDE